MPSHTFEYAHAIKIAPNVYIRESHILFGKAKEVPKGFRYSFNLISIEDSIFILTISQLGAHDNDLSIMYRGKDYANQSFSLSYMNYDDPSLNLVFEVRFSQLPTTVKSNRNPAGIMENVKKMSNFKQKLPNFNRK